MKTLTLKFLPPFWLALLALQLGVTGDSPYGTYRYRLPSGTNDLGSVVAYCVRIVPGETNPVVRKGLSIRVGLDSPADVCFDTELLRYAYGWTGGTLDVSKTLIGSGRGSSSASVRGTVRFATPELPGWSSHGRFEDPRPLKLGPLPTDWGRFQGLYRFAGLAVLHYTIGAADVLEMPAVEKGEGIEAFTRHISLGPSDESADLLVSEAPEGQAFSLSSFDGSPVATTKGRAKSCFAVRRSATETDFIAVTGAPADAEIEITPEKRVVLHLPKRKATARLKVIIARGGADATGSFAAWYKSRPDVFDLSGFVRGGPRQWTESIGTSDGAYVLDTVGLPDKNPWGCWIRPSAFDFFRDGRAAVCTLSGDVWLVSGLDATFQHTTWQRFASGLYEPLGLKIVDDVVYVLGRDQITRLHDLNGDGEADYYENFNNSRIISPVYHAFAFDLQTDSQGNFYYIVGGNLVKLDLPHHSAVIKVSRDGKKLDVVATGFRAPNGLAIGPGDEILCSDNQGHWTPASRINQVHPGGFYGYPGDPRESASRKTPLPTTYDNPLCWLPMTADNSSGSEVWAESDRWGPLNHHWIHTSYGKCWLYYLMTETVGPESQAGAVRFPFTCASGVMRARFNPADGQLYVCGLKGWQTSAVRDGCLQRVRYTGQPLTTPVALHIKTSGAELEFSSPLDNTAANDLANYSVARWNYRWTATYGSEHYSVLDPEKKGEDSVPIDSVVVSPDHRKVLLGIKDLKPVMQMRIRYTLKAADGTDVSHEIFNTINRVGPGETAR